MPTSSVLFGDPIVGRVIFPRGEAEVVKPGNIS
jgi:hypothetical protein